VATTSQIELVEGNRWLPKGKKRKTEGQEKKVWGKDRNRKRV
jgi:hypothetical protein